MNRKVILAAGLFVFCLVGAGSIYYFLVTGDKAAAQTMAAPSPPPPVFIALDPLNVPLWKNDRVRGFYYVGINLQVADAAARGKVDALMPRLRDAFLLDVNSHPMMRRDDPNSIDFAMLKARLKASVDKVVGPDIVQDVLIVRAMRTMG